MNYLSNKLAKVLEKPTLTTFRRSSSVNPSAASIKFVDIRGNEKVIGACMRQQYYRMKGTFPDQDREVVPDWTLAAIMGEALHEMLGDMIDKHGFAMGIQKVAEEHTIYDSITKLSGRSDMIAWDHTTDEPIGIEIKSVGEYKCKTAVQQPIEEHVLQSVVYLDFYNKSIPEGQKKITKWYIWYIARTENWTIKAKPHSSEFAMLWDYCIELKDGVPIIHLPGGVKQRWSQFNMYAIKDRYKQLLDHVDNDKLPDRDYEVKYSEEKIVGMHKADLLTRKMDKTAVDKWLAKGAKKGELGLTLGDGECRFCDYSNLCWNGIENTQKKIFSNFPKEQEKKEASEPKNPYFM